MENTKDTKVTKFTKKATTDNKENTLARLWPIRLIRMDGGNFTKRENKRLITKARKKRKHPSGP